MYASWQSGSGWGGMLTSLSTCSRHVCLVTLRVWVGGMLTSLSTCSLHACFVTVRVWGGVNVIVNLLTPCMSRDTQALGGGDVNVIVNLLTPCMLDAIALGHSLQSSLMVPKQKQDTKGAKRRKRYENASCQGASRPFSRIVLVLSFCGYQPSSRPTWQCNPPFSTGKAPTTGRSP